MKSIITGVLLTALAFPSLAQDNFLFKEAPDAKMGEIVIKGKIGTIHQPVVLLFYAGNDFGRWDTVRLNKGVFELRKKNKMPAYGAFLLKYPPAPGEEGVGVNQFYTAFFEEGVMEIYSPVDSLRNYAKVKGTPLHNRYYDYWNKEGEIVKAQRQLALTFNQATPGQLQDEKFMTAYEAANEKLKERFTALIIEEIRSYPYSYSTLFAYLNFLRIAGINDPAKANEILNLFPEQVRNSKHGQELKRSANAVGGGM